MNTVSIPRAGQFTLAVACAVLCGGPLKAASPVGDVVGKVVVGYQGWFSCAGDGAPNNNWSHWSVDNGLPTPSNTSGIKAWPDVRDYTRTYQTGFANLGNGSPAKLYSPWDQQTVDAQFQSMLQSDIDCAALQRFASWTVPGSARKAQVDGIATRVKSAAQTYGRKFYVMYDCSATDAVDTDWTDTIVNTLHLTSSSSYAMQNGKPVVCMWGVGKSGRGSTQDWVNKINSFKNKGCYVIGGTLAGWRTDTANLPAYNACNMIMPWMVGVISTIASSDSNYTNRTVPDIAYCSSHGMDYQQCVIPGDLSLQQRLHGDLMWHEFYNAVRAHPQGIYIAMFDEYNEGNQIAKTAESAAFLPTNSSFFALDEDGTACWSDYYLRLTGDGGRMLKGEIALTATRPTPPIGGVRFFQNINYGGAVSQCLAKGAYTLAQLAAKGVPNDWASCVAIPAGWTVIMYSNDNFSGTAWTLTADAPDFTKLTPSANDMVSSVKIQ